MRYLDRRESASRSSAKTGTVLIPRMISG